MEHIAHLRQHVSVERACASLGMPTSTYYDRLKPRRPRPVSPRQRPARALSDAERHEVLQIATSERYVDKSPASITSDLLDHGTYMCSPRTLYRILQSEHLQQERRRIARHPVYQKPELMAERPCEVWTWDITKLKGPSKGELYSLYVVLDLFSRFVVGWLLAKREDDALAKDLLHEACLREGILSKQLTIHADNGGVMRSRTVSDLMITLGVNRSHSRPHCSNDNPYSESQFKTMKYTPDFPKRFDGFDHAQEFCRQFFDVYNFSMHHSGIAMLTPAMVHHGQAQEVIAKRQAVLDEAFRTHPERFVNGSPKHQALPSKVWINKPIEEANQVVIS
jgi:putative transposase